MSNLKEKLKRRKSKETTSEGVEVPSELVSRLQRRIDRISKGDTSLKRSRDRAQSRKLTGISTQLAGEIVETSEGEILVNRRTYPPSYCHGRFPAADFLGCGQGLVELSGNDQLKGFHPRGALFLDTETTGLAGGTGTLPFLIGVGWIAEDGSFCTEQYFCREPGEERAQLLLLSKRIAAATSLVTFNGRAFDMPLVNIRFVMQQMKNPGYELPHLDLLHVARRVFKRRLGSVRLGNLEAAVLGFDRVDDIPGHAIPAAYTAFLRGGPVAPMESVLEHNALDLVGLAALGAVLEEMYLNPAAVEHAADHLGLAKAALGAGQSDSASQHLNRAGESKDVETSRDALALAAQTAARKHDLALSLSLWKKAIEIAPDDAEIHLCLAKHLEHKNKDFKGALEHARLTGDFVGTEAMLHRIARIERRIEKALIDKKKGGHK